MVDGGQDVVLADHVVDLLQLDDVGFLEHFECHILTIGFAPHESHASE